MPNTPTNKWELIKELRELADKLNVETVLEARRVSVHQLTRRHVTKDTVAFLIHLDPAKRTIRMNSYTLAEMPKASADYLEWEKEIELDPVAGAQAVLVSVSSLQSLRRAYPNYYLDTSAFVEALRYALRPMKTKVCHQIGYMQSLQRLVSFGYGCTSLRLTGRSVGADRRDAARAEGFGRTSG